MKMLDEVRVTTNKYEKHGIKKGMIGTIIDADIRWNSFYVCFPDQRVYDKDFVKDKDYALKLSPDICQGIAIGDLEMYKDGHASDQTILASLPDKYKNQWCKVEDGYIININGDKKNKTQYDYDS